MVAGLLGNESSDSNRFTLVTPKSENDVRLQATLGNQNPTCLPVGVVSAISNSGESSGVLTAIKEAHNQGATTLSITNSDKSSIALESDYHITTATREKVYLEGYCFSRVTATAVIEILYLFLTTMKEDAHEKSAKHEDLIAGDKI